MEPAAEEIFMRTWNVNAADAAQYTPSNPFTSICSHRLHSHHMTVIVSRALCRYPSCKEMEKR